MNTTVLKALLWKDYRQNRLLFLAGLAMLVMIPLVVCLVAYIKDMGIVKTYSVFGQQNWWLNMLNTACPAFMLTSALVVALFGGTIIAADRADRSGAFLAGLPPSRKMVVLSKVLCALSAVCLLLIINIAVIVCGFLMTRHAMQVHAMQISIVWVIPPMEYVIWENFLLGILSMGAITLLLFGTAWLVGALLGSPVIASTVGIAFVAVGFVLLFFPEYVSGSFRTKYMQPIPFVVAGIVGLACFIAGCLHSLYRKTEV